MEMAMAARLEAQATSSGRVSFRVRVSPRARRDAIEGVAEGALRVRLTAPPVEGKANDALCRFLAERLDIPRSAVRIVSGERSRLKRVEACGVTLDRVVRLASETRQ
jgi:uncharacterized protein (TIGR00251 family)